MYLTCTSVSGKKVKLDWTQKNLRSSCWLMMWWVHLTRVLSNFTIALFSTKCQFLRCQDTHPSTKLRVWDEQISNMYFWEIQSLTLVFFTETVNHSWFLLGWCCRLLWGIFTKWLVFVNCADYFRTCCLHFPLSPSTNGEYALPPTHTSQSPGL